MNNLDLYSQAEAVRSRTMKCQRSFAGMVIGLLLCALVFPRGWAEENAIANRASGAVTSEVLEAKIKAVTDDAGLGEDTKSLLLGLYQQALVDLTQASAWVEGALEFEEKIQTAPEQLRVLRQQIEAGAPGGSIEALGVTAETNLEKLQELLKQETAELGAAEARGSGVQQGLAEAQARPAIIRGRLDAAKREQEDLSTAMETASSLDEIPDLRQARRWGNEAQFAKLAAELDLLQQELLSQPLRVDLLNARLDKENAGIAGLEKRIASLRDWVHTKRSSEAATAQIETEKTLRATAGLDPVLDRLAAQNVDLIGTLKEQAAELNQMFQQRGEAEAHRKRIESDLSDLHGALVAYGRTEGFGRLLLRQYEALPDIRSYVRRASARERQFAELGVRRLDHREESRRIADVEKTVEGFESQMTAANVQALRDPLIGLVKDRQLLLEKALDADEFYLEELGALGIAEKDLLTAAQTCHEFLVENLLWLRTTDPIRWRDVGGVPAEIRRLLDSVVWSEMGQTFRREVLPSPVCWIVLTVVVASVAKRKPVVVRIQGYAERIGNSRNDRVAYTVRAMAATLAFALPWPLLLAALGWTFRWASPTSQLSYATGLLLLRMGLHLYVLRVLSLLCIPRGVAEAHFRWAEADVRLFRRALDRLTWVYVPTVFLIGFSIHLAPAEAGGTIARLSLVVWSCAFALFFFYLFHSRRSWLAQRRHLPDAGFLIRVYPLWCTLLVIFPLGLAVLALTGYVYSATELWKLFLQSLGVLAGVIVLHQFTMRSLRLVRRRLAYAAAVKHRMAAFEARKHEPVVASQEGEEGPLILEESEVDLEALSDDTGELVGMAAIAAGLLGLYLIWDELIPALRILDEVTLWSTPLGSIALGLLAVIFTAVLARRLPAVLEIGLLRFSDLPAGTRNATTTLCVYAIVTLGTLFALNAIGLRWAQFQWLIAALGVGIGFGLQEMVANFISGLIILFERPIRVGDVVTVGDTDGVVTQIRIRATTIRNWDRKELLVPNKEFITGRLLNWTLSDQMTRIVIAVGVAYGSDTDQALALMKEAATEHDDVLDDPAPVVTFEGFGDNSLSLLLRAYLGAIDKRLPTTTDLHKAIDQKFRDAGLVIAFPQSDVHLDISEPLRVNASPQENGGTSPVVQGPAPSERNES